MAGDPSSFKELKMSASEDLGTANTKQSREQPVMPEMTEHASRSLRGLQGRERTEQKTAGSGLGQPFGNMTGSRLKKGGHQMQMPWMQRDQNQGDDHSQFPCNFQMGRLPCERLEADLVAKIALEELNALEMEVMRRQIQVISGRVRVLEDQDATWRYKEAVLFGLLISVSIANLWLWMRQ